MTSAAVQCVELEKKTLPLSPNNCCGGLVNSYLPWFLFLWYDNTLHIWSVLNDFCITIIESLLDSSLLISCRYIIIMSSNYSYCILKTTIITSTTLPPPLLIIDSTYKFIQSCQIRSWRLGPNNPDRIFCPTDYPRTSFQKEFSKWLLMSQFHVVLQ